MPVRAELVYNQLGGLVNRFYKILPLKENGSPTLCQYEQGLLREMLGFGELMGALCYDDRYATLLSVLQYMIRYDPEVDTVRTEVFRSIGLLKDLQKKYGVPRE